MRYAMKDAGAKPFGKIRIGDKTDNVWVVRNHDKWVDREPHELAAEVKRGRDSKLGVS